MRRTSSQSFRVHIFLTILGALFCASLMAYGQSLGEVARKTREKKAAGASTTPPKVIGNSDLPKDPNPGAAASSGESTTQTAPSPASAASSKKAAEQRAAEERAAEQWKRNILAQENIIANLRMRVDRLKASIHFVDPNAGDYVDSSTVYVNRHQARRLERLAQLQQQLAEQRKKLEDMQEAARHAGMHTAVYDP